jgi:hypothetical protein
MEFTAYTPSIAATAIALTAILRIVLVTFRPASKAFFTAIDPFILLTPQFPAGMGNAKVNKSFVDYKKNWRASAEARHKNIPRLAEKGCGFVKFSTVPAMDL